MNSPEDALAQAERHVREGEARITRQVALIEELDRTGHEHAADTARELLETFRKLLQTWRGHLVRIGRRHRRGYSARTDEQPILVA